MRSIWASIVFAALGALPVAARGEVFMLESGGRLEGELVNVKESPRNSYVVHLAGGGKLTLAKDQVKEVVHRTALDAEYERVRPTFPDTVEGQWALAEWCREHGLETIRKRHLQRIIELDPEHVKARRLLDYQFRRGRWLTEKEFWESQGYVNYRGHWMTPQEVVLKEKTRNDELRIKAWKGNLKRWREWLAGERHDEALEQINKIDDPYAVPALEENLKREQEEKYRRLYIEALARIAVPRSWEVLCKSALNDPVEEVRLTCLDYLQPLGSPAVVEFFMSKLHDRDNTTINRAGVALGKLADRTAIPPLIDALITTHHYTYQPPSVMAMAFGSGGFGMGTPPPVTITRRLENQDVLDALVHLTGMSFHFDVASWKKWLAMQKKSLGVNARRD